MYQVNHRRGSYSYCSQVWKRKRVGKENSRIEIKRKADLAQLANMIEGGRTTGEDVTFERKIIVKDESKIAECSVSDSYPEGCGFNSPGVV